MKKNNVPEIRFEGFSGDWDIYKLGKIGEFKNGMNFDKSAMGHGYPFVNLQDVFGKNMLEDLELGLAESTQNQRQEYNLKKGDVLFIRSSVKPEGVGETVLVPKSFENTTYSGFIIRFRPTIEINDNYKRFVFSTMRLRKQIMAHATSSANTNINQESLSKISISLPTLKEQTQIGNLFKQLDDTIAIHQHELDHLKQAKQGFLQKMFPQEGGAVPEIRFPGFSDDWEIRKLEIFIDDYIEKTITQNQYPVLTSSQKFGITYQKDYFADRQVTTESNVGYFVLPRGYFTFRSRSDNGVFKFNRNDLVDKGIISYFYPVFQIVNGNSDFFLTMLNFTIKKQVSLESEGTGQRVLSLKKFKNIKTLIPSIEEQTLIGNFFKQFDDTIALHKRELEHIKQTKKAFLQKMFV